MIYALRPGAFAAAILAAAAAPLAAQADSARATVAIDSAHRQVVITIGPLTIPNLGMEQHSHSMAAHETRMYRAV
ncbi:MAG TPA: hypothetical protein VNH46_09305, partial [Gemmatimonadales bacterium]|nr:hypothetical protein [Gemmatimonadales bacterium]